MGELLVAGSILAAFFAGGLIKIDKHEAKDEKGDYLLTRVTHTARDRSGPRCRRALRHSADAQRDRRRRPTNRHSR